jgi:hypothetical protein
LRSINLQSPPAAYAVVLSFFGIGFGIAAMYAVKQIPRMGRTRIISAVALVSGLAGPPIYTYQSFHWHLQLQTLKFDNCKIFTLAVVDFQKREHRFPADILELAQAQHLSPDVLKISFDEGSRLPAIAAVKPGDADYAPALAELEKQSDFNYTAGNIKVKIPTESAAKIIVVYNREVEMESQSGAVGFADGTVKWVTKDEIRTLGDEDTKARIAMGAASRPAPAEATSNP